MKDLWDKRYSQNEYIYGEAPNGFFKQTIDSQPTGKMLLPAEGEGRNAVYAAEKGWTVDAFDLSIEGKKKALQLADKKGVKIEYKVADFAEAIQSYPENSFDVIALIYVHLPINIRLEYYKKLVPLLKTEGHIILEVFSKEQLKYQKENPSAGGPPHADMLYSEQEMNEIFNELEVILLSKEETLLNEGSGHNGKSSIIRYIGKKK